MAKTAARARLSIDVSEEGRRRLRVAAARRDQTIRDYVWEAVEARLRADERKTAALSGRADPVLNELWDNPSDAIYDEL